MSLDDDNRKKKSKDTMDDSLSGMGERVPRPRRGVDKPENSTRRDSLSGDLDEAFQRQTPGRTLSGEMDRSLVIGDKNWKTMNTVHRGTYQDFGDSSDSLMDDSFASFAGSSVASNTEMWAEDEGEKAKSSQFTTLDDEVSPVKANSPGPRRAAPRRTYSKQSKRMPKKSDPLMAISEAEDDGDL